MERLALLADVHANATALRAVLDACSQAGLSTGVVAGDLVLRGAEPEATVTLVRRLGWPTVAGNTDLKVVDREPRPPQHARSKRIGSRSWTRHQLSPASVDFLGGLPTVTTLELGGALVAVCHATPWDPRREINPSTPTSELSRLVAELEADCIVSGHTHVPHAFRSDGSLFVNPGSVGEAKGDDRRPAWAELRAEDGRLRAILHRVDEPLARLRAGAATD